MSTIHFTAVDIGTACDYLKVAFIVHELYDSKPVTYAQIQERIGKPAHLTRKSTWDAEQRGLVKRVGEPRKPGFGIVPTEAMESIVHGDPESCPPPPGRLGHRSGAETTEGRE